MKTFPSILLLVILTLGFTSCNKEEVADPLEATTPVFRASGTIGTDQFSVIAGEDNFFMHTNSEVVNGVDFFSGRLSDGDFELEMGIYDGNIDLPSSAFAQDLPENISFAMNTSAPLAYLSKDLLPNSALIEEIKWYIDGVYAGLNYKAINTPGIYNVCALVTFTDGSNNSVCNEMILGYVRHANCQVMQFLSQDGNLQAWIDEDLVPVASVEWYVDGQFVDDELKLETTIDQQSHLVSAEITFENGVKRTKSILVDGSLGGYFIDDFSVFENSLASTDWDFKAAISLKKDGKHYLSSTTQNQNSTIHITDISYFGKNAAGKSVFRLIAEVSCMLKEVTSNEMLPFVCTTEFGFEID